MAGALCAYGLYYHTRYHVIFRQMSKSNYTQAQLKSGIYQERIGDTNLHYSMVKKDQVTMSFLTNERLLVYDDNRRWLFYINDFKNTPFRDKVPEPKNGIYTPIKAALFTNPPSTSVIQVKFTRTNKDGGLENVEWFFSCETEKLCKDWMNLFDKEKNKIIEQNTGVQGAGFMHDALLYGAFGEKKQDTILKEHEQVKKPDPQPGNSRISQPRQNLNATSGIRNTGGGYSGDQLNLPQNSNPRVKPSDPSFDYSDTKPINTNIYGPEPTVNVGGSNIKPANSDVRYVGGSNVQPNAGYGTSNPYLPSDSHIRATNPKPEYVKQSDIRPLNANEAGGSRLLPNPNSRIDINTNQPHNSNVREQSGPDWNKIFLDDPTQKTLYAFQKAAYDALLSVWQRDSNALKEANRVYEAQGMVIRASNMFTREAGRLKREFRNYHSIVESCRANVIVGVPLCCLVEWEGVVALVKAPLPSQAPSVPFADALSHIKDLERYTRVSNSILKRATLVDLTSAYNTRQPLIYVDHLEEYLPFHSTQQHQGTVRPQYLFDSVNQVVPGGSDITNSKHDRRLSAIMNQGITKCIKELAADLSSQQNIWVDALELKDIFHSHGVNFKMIPAVHDQVQNKTVRKYIESVIAAKVVKDHIWHQVLQWKHEGGDLKTRVEEAIRNSVEGGSTDGNQFWKQIALRCKRQYGTQLLVGELIPGYFLNSLIKLLRVETNIGKLNQERRVFYEEGIVGKGFVTQLRPKVKTYYRFTTEFIERVRFASRQERKDKEVFEEIVRQLDLQRQAMPTQFALDHHDDIIREYLSYYSPPQDLDQTNSLPKAAIYNEYLVEPPTSFSLKITRNYLNWAVKKEREKQVKEGVEDALRVADYWLGQNHLHHCLLYEVLSDYYLSLGSGDESINYMKESLSRCLRNTGPHSTQAASKYYELGQRELKAGRKREALDNFHKAKTNMESHQLKTLKYPQLLMRLAALHLNNGHLEHCNETAMNAVREFEDYEQKSGGGQGATDTYKVKTFEVLSRAYEIGGRKQELKDLATLCAKKFNNSTNEWVFQQMLRICVASMIYRSHSQQCSTFIALIRRQGDDLQRDPKAALAELMRMSSGMVVMERWMHKFDQIERITSEIGSKRGLHPDTRDFMTTSKLLEGALGEDYLEGLVSQKQYE